MQANKIHKMSQTLTNGMETLETGTTAYRNMFRKSKHQKKGILIEEFSWWGYLTFSKHISICCFPGFQCFHSIGQRLWHFMNFFSLHMCFLKLVSDFWPAGWNIEVCQILRWWLLVSASVEILTTYHYML